MEDFRDEAWFFFVYDFLVCAMYTMFGLLFFLVAYRRRAAIKLTAGKDRIKLNATPQISFVLPVKGTHTNTAAAWISQVNRHGYEGPVEFVFVVQEDNDPAYVLLKQMQEDGRLPADGLRVLVAGLTTKTSQKLHNMIHAISQVSEASELVLMLDDDMLLNSGAVNWLAHELEDPNCLAASGFSCDVPGCPSVVAHAACIMRLVMDISFSSGWAGAAWGGCCLMRRKDLLAETPDGVMQHWKNNGYSDDWIITQVAKRHGKRIANPPCLLFLNLVDITQVQKLYNFVLRQIFVMDTYIESPTCEPHRIESACLPHILWILGLLFSSSLALLPLQIALIFIDNDSTWAERFERPDRVALVCALASMPLCYAGSVTAVRAQAALVTHLSPESGEHLKRDGHWNWWRAPLGFFLFNFLSIFLSLEGYWGKAVVWSGVRYFKRRGRLSKVERLGQGIVKVLPPSPSVSFKRQKRSRSPDATSSTADEAPERQPSGTDSEDPLPNSAGAGAVAQGAVTLEIHDEIVPVAS